MTDAGLRHLAGLTELTSLSLHCRQVTDTGLVHLERLTKLERLRLRNSKVTSEGVSTLRESLPKVQVYLEMREPNSQPF